MTFLETLKANHGELIRLTSHLRWYNNHWWDGNPDRICIILDADSASYTVDPSARSINAYDPECRYAVKLFIDESCHWIWLDERDVEFITNNSSSKS